MANRFPIGFNTASYQIPADQPTAEPQAPSLAPRKSVVQIRFPDRSGTLSYYNDRFDLHRGDQVYVDGKLEGIRGTVEEVNYNFKINLASYKRVIAVVDTHVKGQFHMVESYCVSFDPTALPEDQITPWFLAPGKEEDEFDSGCDDSTIELATLKGLVTTQAIFQRGADYFRDNKVKYLCLRGSRGYAIVTGTQPYEVEFEYRNGQISNLTCSCFCACSCKHEVAVLLQLRELLDRIEERYSDAFFLAGGFSAMDQATLLTNALLRRDGAAFTLH